VAATQGGLVRSGEPVAISVSVWSLVHGLAMLLVHNRLDILELEPARLTAMTEQVAHDALAAVRATTNPHGVGPS